MGAQRIKTVYGSKLDELLSKGWCKDTRSEFMTDDPRYQSVYCMGSSAKLIYDTREDKVVACYVDSDSQGIQGLNLEPQNPNPSHIECNEDYLRGLPFTD